MLDSRPTVQPGRAFPPDTPKTVVVGGRVPALLPGRGPLRAGWGVIAPDDVTGVHLLPKVLFDAALPGQGPPPGQQRPWASPTETVAGPRAALGCRAPETKPQLLLLAATVQATVRAPGGPAARLAASVFREEVVCEGGPPGDPVLGREPGARWRQRTPAGRDGSLLCGQQGPGSGHPGALPEQRLAGVHVLLRYLGDTEKPLTVADWLGGLWLLQEGTFRAPGPTALLGDRGVTERWPRVG